jgi:hypothetical protein
MENFLVVGIGGTGVKILSLLKASLVSQSANRQLPPEVSLLALDTEINTTAATKGMQLLEWQRLYGPEYYSLTGDCRIWVRGKPEEGSPGMPADHSVRTWLDYDFFDQRDDLLEIKRGAGQWRQIGRLAFVYHLLHGEQAALYQTIRNKLNNLPQGNVTIVVCGSVAGGTGASLFVDVAHLVASIADNLQRPKDVYGMVVLPRAFLDEPNVEVSDDMRARSVAALREMMRFASVRELDLGPGIEYVYPRINHPVLSKRVNGSLFKIVYMFEDRNVLPGNQILNPLNVPISHGVAPTVAVWIQSLLDNVAGAAFLSYLTNRDLKISSILRATVEMMVGSIGSYSWVLPRQEILDLWRARLAQEVLDELVPLDGAVPHTGKKGGVPTQHGDVEAESSWFGHPAPGAEDAGRLGQSVIREETQDDGSVKRENDSRRHEAAVLNVTNRREIEEPGQAPGNTIWKSVLKPQNASQEQIKEYDRLAQQYFYNERAGAFIDSLKSGIALPENPRNYTSIAAAASALIAKCNEKEDLLLRAELEPLLDDWRKRQIAAYEKELLDKTLRELNGTDIQGNTPNSARRKRAGKLGWLLAFVARRAEHLALAVAVYLAATEGLSGKHSIKVVNAKITLLQVEMERSHNKQKAYLRERQKLLVYNRRKLMCESQRKLTEELLRFTTALLDELRRYSDMLRTGNRASLWKILERRKGDIDSHLTEAYERGAVRRVLWDDQDKEWADSLYEDATHRRNVATGTIETAKEKVLSDVDWGVSDESPHISLRIHGFTLEPTGPLSHDDIQPVDQRAESVQSVADTAATRLEARCRLEFNPPPTKLTVLGYMLDHWNGQPADQIPQSFASKMLNKTDVLLRLPQGQAPFRAAFLVTVPPSQQPGWDNTMRTAGTTWLKNVDHEVRLQLQAAQPVPGIMDGTDLTSITLLVVKDLVPVTDIQSYRDGLAPYLNVPLQNRPGQLKRNLLHVFPAEQHALTYDRPNDLLPAPQVAVLEDVGRFQSFVNCLAYEFAKPELIQDNDSNAIGSSIVVGISPRPNETDQTGRRLEGLLKWHLTKLMSRPPCSYLRAAETFCIRSLSPVVGNNPSQSIADLLERLTDKFNEKLTSEVSNRMPHWLEGNGDPGARAVLGRPDGPDKDAAFRAIARIEILIALREKLITDLNYLGLSEDPGGPEIDHELQAILPLEKRFIQLMEDFVLGQIQIERGRAAK